MVKSLCVLAALGMDEKQLKKSAKILVDHRYDLPAGLVDSEEKPSEMEEPERWDGMS